MSKALKSFFSIFFFSSFLLISKAQIKKPFECGDDQLKNLLRNIDTAYDYMQLKSNIQLRDYTNKVLQNNTKPVLQRPLSGGDSGYIIPVVVHIIYPEGTAYGTGTNISYAQVRSQIEALNAAFAKNYPAYNGQAHPAYAANTRIRFCLARNTNDTSNWAIGPGGKEYGVMRYSSSNIGSFNHHISSTSATQLLGITHPSSNSFPFDKYLNIWLVSTIEGGNNVMGYAPRPLMPGYLLDGVVMRADIFGDNTTGGGYNLGFGLSEGKILAHEVGHYLNLYHIFQGGCSGINGAGAATDACDLNGDMICDIEPSTTQNIFCTDAVPNTCTANYATGTTSSDMINDYMSYADDNCMNTFTLNQAQRMWATLTLQRPMLWQPENLAATGVLGPQGCVPSYLNAQINTNNAVFCAGSSIRFSNPETGNTAKSYEWRFTGGTPAVAITNTTTVTFAQAGNYKATLKVSDGSNFRTDSLLFTVLECKLDSSKMSMAHWYFGNFGSVDFSSGAPIQTTVAYQKQTIKGEFSSPGQLLPFIAGTISLSDSLGNLLFYSNGVSVWNNNHQKITTAPMFGASDINASTGFCYIPFPGQKSKYFVAGVYPDLDEKPSGIRVVLVDVEDKKVASYQEFSHVSLPKRFSEFLTVVPHCNGTDYWIIVKGFGLEDTKFYSLLVTAAGIDTAQAPVISAGFSHPGFRGIGNQLKSNQRGTKLLLCSPHGYLGIETGAMYDFDSRTGLVSTERKIPDVPGYSNIQGGGAFSPNGEYFYLMRSTNFATNGKPYWLFQYRVRDFKYNVVDAPGFYFASAYQTGPDNQIYVSTQDHFLARISNPDQWGAVSVNGSFINMRSLNDEIRTGVSLPGFIDAKRQEPTRPDFTFKSISCSTFHFSSLCFDNYTATWNFGDGSPLETGHEADHTYANPGQYTVTLSLSRAGITYGSTDKKLTVLPLNASITGPGNVCTNGNFSTQYFGSLLPGVEYKWAVINGGFISGANNLPFANAIWIPTNSSGKIQLIVSRENCLLTVTKPVNISAGPSFKWILPDSICLYDSSIVLRATPAGGSFAGKGVSNNSFSPSIAGSGFHTITYTYFDESTCLGQVEKTIKVSRCKIPADGNTDCMEILNSITIVPNPIGNLLQLRSPYVLKQVQVFNSVGQKVAQGQLNNNAILLSRLAAGMYSVQVYCEQKAVYKAFQFYKL